AIFDDGGFLLEAAFNVAISSASEDQENPFVANVVRTAPGDIAEAEKAMCTLLEKSPLEHIQSIADFLEIPQILTEAMVMQNRNWSAVNLYPQHIAYSQVFVDIIEMKGWTEFTIIYEGAELLPFLENLLSIQDLDSGGRISLESFLEQAQQVGIMSDDHRIRFFDPSLEAIQNFITSVNEKVVELSEGQIQNAIAENGLTLNLALVYDAVTLYTAALNAMGLEEGANVTCAQDDSWNFGSTVINYVRKVGKWTAEDGYTETRTVIPPVESEGSDLMKGKHFIVITALIQADGVYGSKNQKTGKWNGMMEKIMDGRADFGITDLTITSARQKAVDFTSPFMNLGITILYKKPTKEPPNLFSFISPFSKGVWTWLALAYIGVSVLLFALGRVAPEEWQNPYPCIEEPETLDNQWTFANSFWFTLGSVLTQGSELAPIAVSTRMAGSMWWFFTLIMVASYTANLAAFLTVESKFYAIKSVQDLSNNPYGMTYGAKENGATFNFFKESDNILYQKMYQYMEDHPEHQPATNDVGLDRVKSDQENYAFLMESTSIEYMVERNYSPYRQPMSESILHLQEEGTITRMKDKWWKEKRGGGACAPVRHRESIDSGSADSKKAEAEEDKEDKEDIKEKADAESLKIDDEDLAPTPRSHRSTYSRHTLHLSRRQSNAVQMARMRKHSFRN
ncbi:Ionotropic glutamate receptor, partial [Operophtera brumata]